MLNSRSNTYHLDQTLNVIIRKANQLDVPAIVQLIESESMPAQLVEENIDGFLIAVAGDALVACGGIEVYESAGVLRSFVVDAAFRSSGIGSQIEQRLEEVASSQGVRDLYLFTMSASQFWQNRGFQQVSLSDWQQPARSCWQYVYVSGHEEEFLKWGISSWWKHLPEASPQDASIRLKTAL